MEIIIICAILGCIPGAIASSKGRSFGLWWLYGALLFIVAFIHSLCISRTTLKTEEKQISEGLVKCPYCAELIKPEAIKCRYCGSEVEHSKPIVATEKGALSDGTKIRFDRILLVVGAIVAVIIIANMTGR